MRMHYEIGRTDTDEDADHGDPAAHPDFGFVGGVLVQQRAIDVVSQRYAPTGGIGDAGDVPKQIGIADCIASKEERLA